MSCYSSLQHAPIHLVALDGLEERLEIAFAETVVTLALDELEENRTKDRLREDLKQQTRGPVFDLAI